MAYNPYVHVVMGDAIKHASYIMYPMGDEVFGPWETIRPYLKLLTLIEIHVCLEVCFKLLDENPMFVQTHALVVHRIVSSRVQAPRVSKSGMA